MSRPANTTPGPGATEHTIPADDPPTTKEGWRQFVDDQRTHRHRPPPTAKE